MVYILPFQIQTSEGALFEAYLKWNFCNLLYPTFVALIQAWKQGQDKPFYPT